MFCTILVQYENQSLTYKLGPASFIPKEFTSGVYPEEAKVLPRFRIDNPTISSVQVLGCVRLFATP